MDVFVMNNSGTFTDLANGQEKSFIVVGDQVDASDPFEYIDPSLKDIDQQEQIGFDSVWIQKESEAKSLANWITKQWSKQQKVLQVETFLNPLLQVGDIVEVSYPSNKIYSTEDSGQTPSKYVILSIDSTYDSQSVASTQVICRSIYTG
jgi:cystathionine beta-lyase/cystathionine gamma-synthase